MERILISIREATEMLGIGRTTIYRLIAEGRLETVKIGSRRLVKVESLREIIERGASFPTGS